MSEPQHEQRQREWSGREADDVAGRHGGVVDHDARGLGAGLAGLERRIVEGGRGDLGEPRHVVQQCDEACAHEGSCRWADPVATAEGPAGSRNAYRASAERRVQERTATG